jgi:hypothetical protein
MNVTTDPIAVARTNGWIAEAAAKVVTTTERRSRKVVAPT